MDQDVITPEYLPAHIRDVSKASLIKNQIRNGEITFTEAEEQFQKSIILDVLERADYVQSKAASMLGITRRILKYKMDKFGIQSKSS
jgi:transcriptional regulator with GAF, ATPase, and Fis domain